MALPVGVRSSATQEMIRAGEGRNERVLLVIGESFRWFVNPMGTASVRIGLATTAPRGGALPPGAGGGLTSFRLLSGRPLSRPLSRTGQTASRIDSSGWEPRKSGGLEAAG